MTISAIRKVDQYLEITEDGKTRRISVDWADCIVSAIISGRLKVVNIYRGTDNKFYIVYIDASGVQQTVELGGASAISDLTDVDLTGLANGYIIYYDLASLTWKVKAESPGVTHHGALTGLSDDDHTQYELESSVAADAVSAMGVKGDSNPLNHDRYVHPNHSGEVTSVADGAQTIATAAVTLAKMANLAQDKIIGRATASTGVPEALDCTAAGRALLDDATAAAQRTTLGIDTLMTLSGDLIW